MASTFYKYFKENMEATGLSAPASLFEAQGKAISTAKTYVEFIEQFGYKVTVREAIAAGIMEEKMAIAGMAYLSFYTGAVIGSIGVAPQRCAMGGTTISDILWVATRKGIHPPYLHSTLIQYPRILPKVRNGVTNFSGPR
ncbi:hypothetical protein [Rugamonas sp.]|uniref:hypothetical protein n=1 Tax=Rugamonas sp. TaxID=1926287 RepID=UPI0025E7BC9B|nr:hypothetical protein [Rugamonas sp.]